MPFHSLLSWGSWEPSDLNVGNDEDEDPGMFSTIQDETRVYEVQMLLLALTPRVPSLWRLPSAAIQMHFHLQIGSKLLGTPFTVYLMVLQQATSSSLSRVGSLQVSVL